MEQGKRPLIAEYQTARELGVLQERDKNPKASHVDAQQSAVESDSGISQTPRPQSERYQNTNEMGRAFLDLKAAIFDLSKNFETPTEVKSLESVLLSPELAIGYKQIFRKWKDKSYAAASRGEYLLIDPESIEYSQDVNSWINELKNHLKKTNAVNLDQVGLDVLNFAAENLFYQYAATLNVRAGYLLVKEYIQKHPEAQLSKNSRLPVDLQARISQDEFVVRFIQEIYKSEIAKKSGKRNYGIRKALSEPVNIWQNYGMNGNTGRLAGLMFAQSGLEVVAGYIPSMWQKLITPGGTFSSSNFIVMQAMDFSRTVVDSRLDREVDKIFDNLSLQIDKRIFAALVNRVNVPGVDSYAKLQDILNRGKLAQVALVRSLTVDVIPSIFGSVSSMFFLSRMNPILGAAASIMVPVNIYLSKKRNEAMRKEREYERDKMISAEEGKHAIGANMELVTGLPQAEMISEFYTRLSSDLTVLQDLIRRRGDQQRHLMELAGMVTTSVNTVLAGYLGENMGTAMASYQYGDKVTGPIERVIRLFQEQMQDRLKRVEEFERVMAVMESGIKDTGVPVSDLPNLDISFEQVHYRGILRGVDLIIPQGSLTALVGETGAGKSTILRNMSGLVQPGKGEIKLGGLSTTEVKRKQNDSLTEVITYVEQRPSLITGFTFTENLVPWPSDPGSVSHEEMAHVLTEVGLQKFLPRLKEKVRDMSGGELVRLGLARALLRKPRPKIFLLDEPTAGLDAATGHKIQSLLLRLQKKYELTMVIATHDKDLISKIQGLDEDTGASNSHGSMQSTPIKRQVITINTKGKVEVNI